MSSAGYRGRFAPSPTGPLHLGSLLAALASWLDARQHGGQWLVRIEDLDPARERAGAAELQLAQLAACGLHSDLPVLRQSQRQSLYRAAVERLLAAGRAFECSCSRSDLLADGGIHRGCRVPLRSDRRAIRLRADRQPIQVFDRRLPPLTQTLELDCGDFVLQRIEGYYAYQLAVVVDDADQGITDVVRGADLYSSTARQLALQQALALPTPRYLHLPLLRDASGAKLSKSDAATAVDPATPLLALQRVWQLLGQDPQWTAGVVSVGEFLATSERAFAVKQVPLPTVADRSSAAV